MTKFGMMVSTLALALLTGCDNSEQTANDLFVGASEEVSKATASKNPVERFEHLKHARDKVTTIVTDYRKTQSAVRIAANEKIGPLSRAELEAAFVEAGSHPALCFAHPTRACLLSALEKRIAESTKQIEFTTLKAKASPDAEYQIEDIINSVVYLNASGSDKGIAIIRDLVQRLNDGNRRIDPVAVFQRTIGRDVTPFVDSVVLTGLEETERRAKAAGIHTMDVAQRPIVARLGKIIHQPKVDYVISTVKAITGKSIVSNVDIFADIYNSNTNKWDASEFENLAAVWPKDKMNDLAYRMKLPMAELHRLYEASSSDSDKRDIRRRYLEHLNEMSLSERDLILRELDQRSQRDPVIAMILASLNAGDNVMAESYFGALQNEVKTHPDDREALLDAVAILTDKRSGTLTTDFQSKLKGWVTDKAERYTHIQNCKLLLHIASTDTNVPFKSVVLSCLQSHKLTNRDFRSSINNSISDMINAASKLGGDDMRFLIETIKSNPPITALDMIYYQMEKLGYLDEAISLYGAIAQKTVDDGLWYCHALVQKDLVEQAVRCISNTKADWLDQAVGDVLSTNNEHLETRKNVIERLFSIVPTGFVGALRPREIGYSHQLPSYFNQDHARLLCTNLTPFACQIITTVVAVRDIDQAVAAKADAATLLKAVSAENVNITTWSRGVFAASLKLPN